MADQRERARVAGQVENVWSQSRDLSFHKSSAPRFTYRHLMEADRRDPSPENIPSLRYVPQYFHSLPFSQHVADWLRWKEQEEVRRYFRLVRKAGRLERDKRKGKVFVPNSARGVNAPDAVERIGDPMANRETKSKLRFEGRSKFKVRGYGPWAKGDTLA